MALLRATETFFLFALSVDGILGKGGQVKITNLSCLIATKMEEPIFHVKVCNNRHIAIAFARSYYRILCLDWVSSPFTDPRATLGLVFEIGLGEINFLRQNNLAHTYKPHPFEYTPPTSFAQHTLRANHPPPPTTNRQVGAHGYVPKQLLRRIN